MRAYAFEGSLVLVTANILWELTSYRIPLDRARYYSNKFKLDHILSAFLNQGVTDNVPTYTKLSFDEPRAYVIILVFDILWI